MARVRLTTGLVITLLLDGGGELTLLHQCAGKLALFSYSFFVSAFKSIHFLLFDPAYLALGASLTKNCLTSFSLG